MLVGLAWRNLWRRPQRTALSMVSIAIVSGLLVFVLSFQDGVYSQMKETTLRIFDGYAQVQPAGYADDPTVDRTIERPELIVRKAEAVGGVTAAAPGQRLRDPGQWRAQLCITPRWWAWTPRARPRFQRSRAASSSGRYLRRRRHRTPR